MRAIIGASLWLLLIGGVAFVHYRSGLTRRGSAAAAGPCPITVKEWPVQDYWCMEITCKGEQSIWIRTNGPPVLVWKSKPE